MAHFRQKTLLDQFFESTDVDSFTHVYKDKEYTVSRDMYDTLDKAVLQSVATRLAKQNSSQNMQMMGSGKGEPSDGEGQFPASELAPANQIGGEGYDTTNNNLITDAELIRYELLRLSRTEHEIEDKLHMPRVFKKLLSEPHLALYERKKVIETKQDLYLFVDKAVSYNSQDNGFHNTLIQEAKKIKGIHVFGNQMLRLDNHSQSQYYLNMIPKLVPRGKTILAISQGCGNAYGEAPPGYNLHFATFFKKTCNCGCNSIRRHENMKNVKNIHYGIVTPKELKKIVLY